MAMAGLPATHGVTCPICHFCALCLLHAHYACLHVLPARPACTAGLPGLGAHLPEWGVMSSQRNAAMLLFQKLDKDGSASLEKAEGMACWVNQSTE